MSETFDKQPQFRRLFKDLSDQHLLNITRSVPHDYRLSTRIDWEDRMVAAYAEIGIRMVNGVWNG